MEQYLQHYGVKGQKWGMRRYRNEDGSLTSEGRDHYGIGDPRKPGAAGLVSSNPRKTEHDYRVKKYGKATAKTLDKKPKNTDDTEKKKRAETAKKILTAVAAASLTAVAAYATSKHIKNKANSILNHEHSKELRTIFNQHDLLANNISKSGYDRNTINSLLDNQRNSTNAHLNAQMRYRDYQRSKNNRSTLESLRYIRNHRR